MGIPVAALLSLLALLVQDDAPTLLQKAVAQLVAIQEESGAWPYEGVYRVGRVDERAGRLTAAWPT